MELGLLVPLSPFIMVIAIVWFVSQARARSNEAVQKTVQKAIEKGVELTPDTIKAMGVQPNREPNSDLRRGLILIATALGLVVLGYGIGIADGDEEATAILSSIAAIPGFIGLALIGMHIFANKKPSD